MTREGKLLSRLPSTVKIVDSSHGKIVTLVADPDGDGPLAGVEVFRSNVAFAQPDPLKKNGLPDGLLDYLEDGLINGFQNKIFQSKDRIIVRVY